MIDHQAKHRLFSTTFWRDDFVAELSRDTRHFYQYILTAPESNIAGVYKTSYRIMQFDDGWTREEVDEHFAVLSKAGKAFFYAGWVIIPSVIKKHQWSKRDNRWNGVAHTFNAAPDHIKAYAITNGWDWDFVLSMVGDSYKGVDLDAQGFIDALGGIPNDNPEGCNNPKEGSERVQEGYEGLADPEEHINPNLNPSSSSILNKESGDPDGPPDTPDGKSVKSKRKRKPKQDVEPVGELYHRIKEAYESQWEDNALPDYAREGPAIKKLVAEAESRGRDAPVEWAKRFVNTHWRLKRDPESLLHGNPFLPSIGVSSGLKPRILEAMQGPAQAVAQLSDRDRRKLADLGVEP